MLKRCLSILIMICFCQTLKAEMVYVTDVFEVPLRTGMTNAYRIKALLKSGTSLDLLETDSESGYSRVITKKGTEGWILTHNLIKDPVARKRIPAMDQKMQKFLQQKNNAETAAGELKEANASLQSDNQALNELNNKLADELAYIQQVSGSSIKINQRNKELTEENQQLQNQLDLLSAENSRIKGDTSNDFFLYGAGTIILGIILGLVISSLRPKRKDPGWV